MKNSWIRLNFFIAFGVFFALAGAAWAADCGDTDGVVADVPCVCGDRVVRDTTLISPAVDPVNGDPVVSTSAADVCPADGLIVADGVELDLNGNTIRGSNIRTGVLIQAGADDVKIKNGTIRNFKSGVAFEAGAPPDLLTLEQLRVRFNQIGALLDDPTKARIKRNTFRTNQIGLWLRGRASQNLVFGNRVRGNDIGILLGAEVNRQTGDLAQNCSSQEPRGNEFRERNRVQDNRFGIILACVRENRVENNQVSNSAIDGIRLIGSSRNIIRINQSFGSRRDDFLLLDGSQDNIVEGNRGGSLVADCSSVDNLIPKQSISEVTICGVSNIVPVIVNLSPNHARVGMTVDINGAGFSRAPGENRVQFGGVTTPVLSASETRLRVRVPNLPPGRVNVTVMVNGETSNSILFTVER